jgi:hypothetical protein
MQCAQECVGARQRVEAPVEVGVLTPEAIESALTVVANCKQSGSPLIRATFHLP